MTLLVSSVPLSLPMACGRPCRAISRSSSRATRRSDSEKSAIDARQRRVPDRQRAGLPVYAAG